MGLSGFLSWFGWKPDEQETPIGELLNDIKALLAKNKIGFLEIEREIGRVKIFEQNRVDQVKEGLKNECRKRMTLREIVSLRKRLKTLDRVGNVYQQNIDIHLAIQEQLEDQLAAGMKSMTQDQLEEIVLDHEEMLTEHREVMASSRAVSGQSYLSELKDDPELNDLAKELEAEFAAEALTE